jgi:hypothetical protein
MCPVLDKESSSGPISVCLEGLRLRAPARREESQTAEQWYHFPPESRAAPIRKMYVPMLDLGAPGLSELET